MTDKYQRIRDALAMGPTPGPFGASRIYSPGNQELILHLTYKDEYGLHEHYCTVRSRLGGELRAEANAAMISACDPDTIRELLAERDALQAECERLRTCLAETAGVAVTMLYESHKADTIKEFTVEQLSQMVETTKHLADANIQVEKVYRKAWSMAQGCAGADWGGVK